jgi:hypothetical protein
LQSNASDGPAAFERAVREYRLTDLAPPSDAVQVAAGSLACTGLFLLGEVHGVAQTPCAIFGLVSRLGVRALAFEWSHDELDGVIQPALASGVLDARVLWALLPNAEVFSGDGRFTAGHVCLIEQLASRLERVVLLDEVGSSGQQREEVMATRLLGATRRDSPMLAVLGVAHVMRSSVGRLDPVGLLVERELPGVANGFLAPSSVEPLPVDVVVPIGAASPAVAPRHPLRAE